MIKTEEIILIEVQIASQNGLPKVEARKERKYGVLANNIGIDYRCPTKIILDANNMG